MEALEQIVDRHLLTRAEEVEFVSSLDFKGREWLRDLYYCRMAAGGEAGVGEESKEGEEKVSAGAADKTHDEFSSFGSPDFNPKRQPPTPSTPASASAPAPTDQPAASALIPTAFHRLTSIHSMGSSPEVLSCRASSAYSHHQVSSASRLCAQVHRADPLCEMAACTRVACLVDMRRVGELFYLAHQLVDSRPRSAVSWFAVGAYYHLIGKNDLAQRHFGKASRLNPRSVEAWVAFGNAFAAQDESDQAMSAYRAAQRLFNGSHVPLLYIGMEYIRTNNRSLAKHFLLSATNLNRSDPLAYNELGVVSFRQGECEEAAQLFFHSLRLAKRLGSFVEGAPPSAGDEDEDADLSIISEVEDPYFEPTINNLGQCFRKLRRFSDAIYCFEVALALVNNAGTRAALAFSKHLAGYVDDAIADYHEALAMKPDDAFSAEMLNKALEDLLSSGQAMPPAPGAGSTGLDDDEGFEIGGDMTMSSRGDQSSVMMNESDSSFIDASGGMGEDLDDDVSMTST